MKSRFLTVLLAVVLVGCSTYSGLRDANRKNIQSVRIGDTESLVVAKMGESKGGGLEGEVTNPY